MLTEVLPRDDDQSPLRLTTTASTPASAGPSTPISSRSITRSLRLEQPKTQDDEDEQEEDIVPPARPSSTPFPQQDEPEDRIQFPRHTNSDPTNPVSPSIGSSLYGLQDDLTDEIDGVEVVQSSRSSPESTNPPSIMSSLGAFQNELDISGGRHQVTQSESSSLCNLPIEIHECILDHLFGVRLSASSRTSPADMSKSLRNWNTKLRHCRRREVSDLALVSKKWKELIQDRLYRHIKIKGTKESIDQAVNWFIGKAHLTPYVKHVEIWFPVFQQKTVTDRTLRGPSITPNRPTAPLHLSENEPSQLAVFHSPHNNCTLEEVFRFIQLTFGEACVLTLEGGERKKPPMVKQFANDRNGQKLPILDRITTLVCKGQWNLLRTNDDFQVIANALPNLSEWHGSYAKPKSKSYICMARIFPYLPENLTHLNIVLESDYRREAICPSFYRKVNLNMHFCSEMARAMPALEHFAYTGRLCSRFFDSAAAHSNKRNTRLKTIDLTVKNVCRKQYQWNDGSGVTDSNFVLAFESLVLSACRSLNVLATLEFLRIKFIDLDSQFPSLNPYFEIKDNVCTGIWSEKIVGSLAQSRPNVFIETAEQPADVTLAKNGQLTPSVTVGHSRPPSIKVSTYLALGSQTGITIT
ncbi:hypothetical protein D0Z07_8489 [Hyphodiscus hymeniophilus]|uniref:Uncharacterized protein n=1 Tax=Hyphodiscus hymeniophilus TaxID=353542 RepID=A0A9P6VDS0_9HELO|nr:hypothetical protein D0Z07_8489 [Hyphodiscus hymeniophilus]